LNNFASIFELLAGFNAALILSNRFLEDINIKFTGISDEIKELDSNINTNLNNLSQVLESLDTSQLSPDKQTHVKKLEKILKDGEYL